MPSLLGRKTAGQKNDWSARCFIMLLPSVDRQEDSSWFPRPETHKSHRTTRLPKLKGLTEHPQNKDTSRESPP